MNYYNKIFFYFKYLGLRALDIFMRRTSFVLVGALALVLFVNLFIFYRQAVVISDKSFIAEGVSIKKVNSQLYDKILKFVSPDSRGSLPRRDIFNP